MNYLLILMGISLLIIGIRCILQFVNTKIVYELPYSDDEGIFTIYNRGEYGLWLSGTLFKKSPLGDFGIEIVNQKTGEYIPECCYILFKQKKEHILFHLRVQKTLEIK